MEGVYLLHFNKPYKGCSHYIGWSANIGNRFRDHVNGVGNPLVKAVIDSGSHVTLTRTWPDQDRNFERKLKNRKKSQSLCPCCNPNWKNNGKEN